MEGRSLGFPSTETIYTMGKIQIPEGNQAAVSEGIRGQHDKCALLFNQNNACPAQRGLRQSVIQSFNKLIISQLCADTVRHWGHNDDGP